MGCDIHMFIEYRNAGCPWQADEHHKEIIEGTCIGRTDDEKDWCDECRVGKFKECDMAHKHYNKISATSRDYNLFGLLAGVRGTGPRKPKGLPSDVSDPIREASEHDGSDGHSHSYISLEEFEKVLFEEYAKGNKSYGYKPTDNTNIFYDWEDFMHETRKERPPDYSSIVAYGKQLQKKHNVENMMFDDNTLNDVEVRLVFWFDN